MRLRIVRALCSLIAIAPAFCYPAAAQNFPVIQPGQTSYTITPDEVSGIIDTLYLPDGFTLKVDPRVRTIDWSVKKIKIGAGVTIDLSASDVKPPKASNGAPKPQAEYCQPGAPGNVGANGTPGTPGVSLTIHDVDSVEIPSSLWVRTDGGPGGDGGDGGDGQTGGGKRSIGAGWGHGGPCGSAGGGPPGAGGAGGPGGAAAKVVIKFKDPGTTPITNGFFSPQCGPSQRPTIDDGILRILSISGCPGDPGAAGAHPGGHG